MEQQMERGRAVAGTMDRERERERAGVHIRDGGSPETTGRTLQGEIEREIRSDIGNLHVCGVANGDPMLFGERERVLNVHGAGRPRRPKVTVAEVVEGEKTTDKDKAREGRMTMTVMARRHDSRT